MEYWGQFKKLVLDGVLEFDQTDIKGIDDKIDLEGVKPMHHTEPYREAYYPAYRVVLLKVFEELVEIRG